MRRQGAVLMLVAIMSLGMSPSAWGQDLFHKAGRGIVNVLTGWIEIPKQVHIGSRSSNPVVGLARGAFKGLALAVLRSGIGLFEALTFPFEIPKDYASPYEQMELPDYAWE